jgi:hypothetical protein
MTATLGKISPVILTTAQRDAIGTPDAHEGGPIIWHSTLARLEYWGVTEAQWLPFDQSFPGDTEFVQLSPNVGINLVDTDIMSLVVPAGGIFFVEGLLTMAIGATFLDDADTSVLTKLTDSADVELSHALVKAKRPASTSEQYYFSVTVNTIVDTTGGSETIKTRAIRTGTPLGGVQATGGSRSQMYCHKVLE